MTDTLKTLQFSIGPVQGWVGESRRTRDLWASSFLLSYLSGCAMAGVLDGPPGDARPEGWEGRITLPNVDNDDMLECIRRVARDEKLKQGPQIATLPNRFVAQCSHPELAAMEATRRLHEAWKTIADHVWERLINAHIEELGNKTRDIWTRQVKGFWDIQWVVGEDLALLDRRKNLRTHTYKAEPGTKCTVMEGWQELSGHIRSYKAGRTKHDAFWEAMRGKKKVNGLDLRDDERLCALAAIKRFFSQVSEDSIGWTCDTTSWPSTVYMAAVPWLQEHLEHDSDLVAEYIRRVHGLLPPKGQRSLRSEVKTRIRGINQSREVTLSDGETAKLAELDGNLYLDWGLNNIVNAVFGHKVEPNRDRKERDKLQRDLERELTRLHQGDGSEQEGLADRLRRRGKPAQRAKGSPFYGMLLMDGDSMGRLLRALDAGTSDGPVTRALGEFAANVGGVVSTHSGVLIYAGGDDVLAMVPRDQALACANALAKEYDRCFEGALGARYSQWREHTTISGAVVFAHAKVPMRTVLQSAHALLDHHAKDGNGRASLAVEVIKSSGLTCRWVTTWKRLRGDDPTTTILEALSDRLEREELSSSLIYRLREDMGVVCGWDEWRPGRFGEVAIGDTPTQAASATHQLLRAAIAHCWAGDPKDEVAHPVAEEVASILHAASYRAWREERVIPEQERVEGGPTTRFDEHHQRHTFGMDAALLARFIVQNGWEEDR